MTSVAVCLPGDGLMLVGEAFGDPDAPTIVLLHGGGQSRRSWLGTARRMGASGCHAIALDLRGHGDSDWAPDGDYLLDAYARDVEALLRHLGRPIVLAGASRGGEAALVAAARVPKLVRLLVLADVTPFMDDTGIDVFRAFFRASYAGFASIDEAADTLGRHLGRRRDASGLAQSLRREGDRWFWHWDPRTTDDAFLAPVSEGEALVAAARAFDGPLLLVKGEHSDLVSDESVAAFRRLAPQLEVELARGVGHMFTGDRNEAFAATLLNRIGGQAPAAA